MRRSGIRHVIVTVALIGGVLVGSAGTAGAGGPSWNVTDGLDGYADELVIGLANRGSQCDGSGTEVLFYDLDDNLLDSAPLSAANVGTVVVPDDLADSHFYIRVSCSSERNTRVGRPFEYAGLDVTKAVDGTAPAGTSFVIQVDCDGDPGNADRGPYDLTFDADGGTNRVWFSEEHLCEITETDDGGADSATIVSEDCNEGGGPTGNGAELVSIDDPVLCDATVTNTFEDTTTSTSTTSTSTTTTSVPGGDVSPSRATPATPATPTKARPTFTG